MRRFLTASLVVGCVSLISRDAAAQSVQDAAAASALLGTPVGALTPVLVSPGTKGEKAFNSVAGRYSYYSPSSGDGNNTLGGTFYHQAGMNAAFSGTAAYTQVGCPGGGCDNLLMLGGDLHSTLWNNAAAKSNTLASINLQGSLGWGKAGDVSFLSAAIGVPLAMSMEQSSKARIGGFVTPGFGWGRMSFDASGVSGNESGTRPIIGAGAFWMSPAGWGLHASYSKVVIDNGGNSFGLGFSWNLAR
jgi:hypothetical protein